MYLGQNSVHPIVVEASSMDDRRFMRTMNKQDVQQINANLLQKLYKSALERNTYDFGEIPDSKGDIEALKCYKPTMECITALEDLLNKNRINEPALDVVKLAISNIKMLKPYFVEGFKLKEEWIMVAYNTTIMAVIDAVTMLIAEYMNYMVGPIKEPFKLTGKTDKSRGIVCVNSLKSFNSLVKDGTLQSTLQASLHPAKKNLTGEVVAIGAGVIIGLVAVINLIRLLIFYFYQSRVKMSEYLEMESSFLEANRLSVEASKLPPDKKQKVLINQEKVILKMRRLADRLKINMEDAGEAANTMAKDENNKWSLKEIEKDMTNQKMNGGMSSTII